MVEISGGTFLSGEGGALLMEVHLETYWIDRFEVTNSQFQEVFPGYSFPAGREHHPVTRVTWDEALAYCESLDKRLPTGAEWEKAARGTDGRTYPWGNKALRRKAHPSISGMITRVVGYNKKDVSVYGVREAASSVWEWTSEGEGATRMTRGGLWNHHLDYDYSKTTDKNPVGKNMRFIFLGFRCARGPI